MSTLPTTPPPLPDEERVRRLLADARHTEPMPDDVADRLDRVLAGLGPADATVPLADADPAEPPVPATDLDAVRRRRRARTWLAAAAAIAVVGIGVDQLAPDLGSVGGSSSSSDAGGSSGATAQDQDSAAPGTAGSGASAGGPRHPVSGVVGAVPLRADRFGTQVARLRDGALLDRAARQGGPANDEELQLDGLSAQVARCVGGHGRGRYLPVRYDGEAGVLVYRPVRGDTQVVDLFLCGQDAPARSITLPAP